MLRAIFHSSFKSLLVVFCLLGLAQSALATTVIMPSDDDMIIGARAIVRGKVISMGSALDKGDDLVYTYITLRIQEALKGEITTREIVIKQEGGQLADRGNIIYGSPEFTLDEDVLVYLDTRLDGSLRVHQMFLGKFSITIDPGTGHQFVTRSGADNGIAVLPPHSHGNQPSASATNRMELNAYLEMVAARLAANREASDEFLNRHYRYVPMLMMPSEYESESFRRGVEPAFTTISSSNPRWFEPDSGLPVVFNVNSAGAPNAQINSDITAAMNAWSSVPGNPLRVQLGGNTSSCTPTSSENVILFNGCDGRWSPTSGCSGTLAQGGLSWSGTTIVLNGVTFRRASRGFVSFNPFASCHFGNSCNVREVTTHELGHALGLGHSQFSAATMFFQAHFDGRCAFLHQDDIDGINYLQFGPGGGGGGNPLTIVTNSPLANGTQSQSYSQTLVATGGQTPYSWSVIAGQLPAGLSLSSGGVISGVPNSSGTSNFTVRVADNAAATAQKAFSITVTATGQPDSQFISQVAPATLQPGQQFNVTLRWFNTGTEMWSGTGGFSIVSQNPPNNVTWGGNTVSLNGFFIFPGQLLDITFTAFAPQVPGTYNFQWQLSKTGLGFFGQTSTNVAIQVGSNCTYSISPTSQNFSATGGTGNVSVSTQSGCSWTAMSNASWINVTSGASGTGNGSVNFSVAANSSTSSRTGTLTVAGQTFTVTQAGAAGCTYSISPTSQNFSSTGGTGNVSVSTQSGCSWTATSNASWINVTSSASGTGNGSANFSVAANSSTSSRTGTLTVAGQTFTVTQAGAASGNCTSISISPASRSFGSFGGSGSITVTAQPGGCAWTAVSDSSWLFVSTSSGTGSRTIKYFLGLNPGPSRVGTITVGNQVHTVNQSGTTACTFSISPTSQNFSATGGTGNVSVSNQNGCGWTATSNASWINVTSGASGTGNGSVNFSVAANSSPVSRTGTMTIATQTFTVIQAAAAGCTYSISPTSQNFSATGGTGNVSVSTQSGCSWTATSNASWINVTSGASGTGNGSANFSVAANSSTSSRTGTLTVAGQTFTVTQAAAASNCTFTLSSTSQSFAKFGGIGSVNVSTASGCEWTATSNANWIFISSGSSGSGNGTVRFMVGLNPGAPRTGTMTIAGKTFTITQQ